MAVRIQAHLAVDVSSSALLPPATDRPSTFLLWMKRVTEYTREGGELRQSERMREEEKRDQDMAFESTSSLVLGIFTAILRLSAIRYKERRAEDDIYGPSCAR